MRHEDPNEQDHGCPDTDAGTTADCPDTDSDDSRKTAASPESTPLDLSKIGGGELADVLARGGVIVDIRPIGEPSEFDKWVRHCLSVVDDDQRARPRTDVPEGMSAEDVGLVSCGWIDDSRIYLDAEIDDPGSAAHEPWTCPKCGGTEHEFVRVGDLPKTDREGDR